MQLTKEQERRMILGGVMIIIAVAITTGALALALWSWWPIVGLGVYIFADAVLSLRRLGHEIKRDQSVKVVTLKDNPPL